MSLYATQTTLKRDHNSFSEECANLGDATTASLCSRENSQIKFETATAAVSSVVISASPKMSPISEVVATSQSPLKKTKLLECDFKSCHYGTKELEKLKGKTQKEMEREIERQKKETERKKKGAEREEKRAALEVEKKAREEKRRKIEEDKKRKEDERQKKERSQMRLGSFFTTPSSLKTHRENLIDVKVQSSTNSTSHREDTNSVVFQETKTSTQPISPYSKLFPDFFIQNGVTLAPSTRLHLNQNALKVAQDNIDGCINGSGVLDKPPKVRDTLNLSSKTPISRDRPYKSTRQIMEDFYDGKSNRKNISSFSTENLLKKIPMKFLKFHEDVRPPYIGTYSSRPIHGTTKLARNPLRRDLPDVNYDYDSEAEWLEDEEGEELRSDDEEDETDDVEDIDGFLDDENDETPRSRNFDLSGDLEPVSTGLCWEDHKIKNPNMGLETYRMEFILNPDLRSINPFLTSYWTATDTSGNLAKNITSSDTRYQGSNSLNHSATNFDGLSLPTVAIGQVFSPHMTMTTKSKNKETNSNNATTKLIASEDMAEFKSVVVGSDLSKIGLIEVLKKRFPGRPAAVIKATLEAIARRGQKGQKEAEKRWVLL